MTNRTIPEWVRVGAEVVPVRRGFGRSQYDKPERIAKVYKNGNFVLEGHTEQWRPRGDIASRAGDKSWTSSSCCPLTDELRAEIVHESKVRAAQKLISDEAERLAKLSRSTFADVELLAEAERIMARPEYKREGA
jgi:hypothetical protein